MLNYGTKLEKHDFRKKSTSFGETCHLRFQKEVNVVFDLVSKAKH